MIAEAILRSSQANLLHGDKDMFEPATTLAQRQAFERAKAERAEAFRAAFSWLFTSKGSR